MSTNAGLDPAALERLAASIESDVESGLYDGAVILVARGGEVGLHRAVGYSDRSTQRATSVDDVFRIFSMTKTFTNALVLKAFDRGLVSPTTKVVDVIPEFAGSDRFRTGAKSRVSIEHLMTHRAALSPTPWPVPPLEAGDQAHTIAAICEMDLVGIPGERVNYSPCLSHALLGEIVRRTLGDGRTFTQTLEQELLDPLGMTETSMGAPTAWADRLVPVAVKFPPGGFFSPEDIKDTGAAAYEGAEMPWVGCVSTVRDVFRFTEMLRRGGEFEGNRVLSPASIALATRNHTGDLLNDRYAKLVSAMEWYPWVANIGLGFMLRGPQLYQTFFGTMASAGTFGGYGAGSSQFWIDPERDLTFVCMTAGVLGEADNVRRFQRLSDMALAAAV
ncbi:serine hydrolase domain-containing protein [Agreia sp. VKM Ac-1783]|uniref:serine hydrolase domain-containing protein n=1 Tax=Agreia sp. VKM Ac-1783 TaxID=1938889 RepID=UPI000A2AB4D9|nr:serine hydrolase domain-containing protein [Agreia sp. VKM Ac-1783]SMQ74792.1 CubicO group peptidase, beta-lactamase class C family [Agreia sp. VKM Ac-1783]